MKPTSLDYAILGILSQSPQTGYGVRKIFETTALGNYSSSPGTIYPALKRLHKLDLVNNEENSEGKAYFKLTKKGLLTLKNWLLSKLSLQDIQKDNASVLLRFAFMEDLLTHSQILSFLDNLETTLRTYLKELNDYHKNEHKKMPLTGRLAFEYGIASYKTMLEWCLSSKIFFT